jgi:hypothetical protein
MKKFVPAKRGAREFIHSSARAARLFLDGRNDGRLAKAKTAPFASASSLL